jgi:hypothetical protein
MGSMKTKRANDIDEGECHWFDRVFVDALQGVTKVKRWLNHFLESVVLGRVLDVIASELGPEACAKVRDGVKMAIATAPDPYCGRERCSDMCASTGRRCPNKATFGSLCYAHHKCGYAAERASRSIPEDTVVALKRSASDRAKTLLQELNCNVHTARIR